MVGTVEITSATQQPTGITVSEGMRINAKDFSADAASPSLAAILSNKEHRSLLLRITVTLTLGIMGGAVLPVSWGFQQSGIAWGFGLMFAVCIANLYTCELLLRQAQLLNVHDYESLSLAIGGRFYKYFTDFAIIILLFGSLLGGIEQVGEAGAIGLQGLSSKVPHWLIGRSGSLLMVFGTIFIALPLCHYSRLQELDKAATIGTVLVLWLLVAIMIRSIQQGLPAIGDGLDITGIPSMQSLSQAVSIFGFAFYIQPFMMPYLLEVPSGKVGISILTWGTRFVVLGISFLIYGIIGFFGAACYGDQTSANILENKWMGGGIGQGVLNLSISLYLILSIPLMEFPIRHTINSWSQQKKNSIRHRFIISTVIISLSLMFALIFPQNSGQVLVVTGAVGVCIVSYLIPIINHFWLYFKRAKPVKAHEKEKLGHAPNPTSQENRVLNENDIHASNRTSQKDKVLNESDIHVSNPTCQERRVLNEKPFEGDQISISISTNNRRVSSYRRQRNDGIWNMMIELLFEILIPFLVVVLGFFCSIMSLYTL